MSFVSLPFLIFFPTVLLLTALLPKTRLRHIALLIASYVFYGWWDCRFCFLMLGLTAISYVTALALEKRPKSKPILAVGVAVPLLALFLFKYLNFFVDTFCLAFGIRNPGTLNVILPVGISFYTFQSLSYTIDAYRGRVKTSHDPVKFALYISFFPQLVAGPIVKASDFLPQLEEDRRPTLRRLGDGLSVFFWGMLKKAVLADQIAPFVDSVFDAPGVYSSGTVALAVVAYALQIYFDFSGYSDMAIGCAKCMGYDLNRNFDLPYLSANVTEFWKRWHISLSGWLQQYLYIPLGGNRKGAARTYLNLMITMLLGGLWHGAGLNFILWGGLHGAALCVHKLWMKHGPSCKAAWWRVLSTILTFAFVCLCWVFFRAQTMQQALAVLNKLFVWSDGVRQIYLWAVAALIGLAIATLWCAFRCRDDCGVIHGDSPAFRLGTFWGTLGFALLVGFTLILMYTGDNPFIYFQF